MDKKLLYSDVRRILLNDIETRKDNRLLLAEYYKQIHGLTLDEAFKRNDVPNYQTIERTARREKQLYHELRVDKTNKVDEYKEIAREIPVFTKVF